MAAEANSYDAWFCAQVQAALEDARSGTSQVQVMQAASPDQALEVSAV
jgi:hypothetical protein